MIRFENIFVTFDGFTALSDVNVDVAAGTLCVLVGPSGSGKSTLMRLVNRLVEPSSGRVMVRGQDVSEQEPAKLRRSIGYVMQSTGLFPHRSVAENIGTVPRLLGWDAERIAARVTELLAMVQLDPSLGERRPGALSGGQAQRVGLARALAADPDILLMDEPFGAVDPMTRRDLRTELRRIHAETGKTILLVTHDPEEALELGSQIVVLRDGQVVADGTPSALVAPDAPAFARELLGGGQPGLRRLSLLDAMDARDASPAPQDAPELEPGATLADALSRMAETGCDVLALDGGSLRLDAVLARGR